MPPENFVPEQHRSVYLRETVGLSGLEPLTPALSAQCSNRLSYRPMRIEFSGAYGLPTPYPALRKPPRTLQRYINR